MKYFITLIAIIALVGIIAGMGISYAKHGLTCAADNANYHTVFRDYQPGNIIPLSQALTRLARDNCPPER